MALFGGFGAGQWLAGARARRLALEPPRLERALSLLVSGLFPVVAVCHPFLDIGYFVFLHGGGATPSGRVTIYRAISDCHFRKTATACDRKPGIKWLSCTAK